MVRCTYFYETPMGFSFGDVVAESREAADREFWSRHHRDTCCVLRVSVTDDQEGEERAEDRADGRGDCPGGGAGEELGPAPASPGEGPEGGWHVDFLFGPCAKGTGSWSDVDDKWAEYQVLLLVGKRDEVKVHKLAKHAQLVRGCDEVVRLEPGHEVAVLSRVPSDSPEEGDQVGGDGLHGEAPSGRGVAVDCIPVVEGEVRG